MEHVELVVLFLLVAVAVLTALARRARRALPDPARGRRQPRRLRPRGAGRSSSSRSSCCSSSCRRCCSTRRTSRSLRDLRADLRPISAQRGRAGARDHRCSSRSSPHAAIDGMPWAAAFALGAIVSPTDPLAATAIMRRLGVPRSARRDGRGREPDQRRHRARPLPHRRRGGRGRVQPARRDRGTSSSTPPAGSRSAWRWARCSSRVFRKLLADDVVGVVLSLAAGYLGYLPAEELDVSGVLAAVVGRPDRRPALAGAVDAGLAAARLRVLGGAGLPAQRGAVHPRRAAAALDPRGAGALGRPSSSGSALLVSAAVIGARLVWSVTAPYVIRAIDRREVAARPPRRAGACGWCRRGPGCAARSRSPPRWRCRRTSPSAA